MSPLDQVNGNKLVPKKDKPNGSIKLKKAIVKKSEPKEGESSGMLCELLCRITHLNILQSLKQGG